MRSTGESLKKRRTQQAQAQPKWASRTTSCSERGVSSRPQVRTLFQEGHCESPHCTARQHATPSLPCPQEMSCLIGPTSASGLVASFLRPACSNATLGRVAAPLLEDPSRWRGDTNVVSMASWAPFHRTNPSAITSFLRPSSLLNSPKSKSRMNAFVVTHLPPCTLVLQRTPEENLSFPKPLLLHAARW